MPLFTYKAQKTDGKTVTGKIESADRDAALKTIANQNLRPLVVEAAKKKGLSMEIPLPGGGVKSTEIVIFTRQLSTMVSAGVPLVRALTTLANQTGSKKLKSALDQISHDVQSGLSLGESFAKHPSIFNDIYVNMVRAGEAGGILDDILKRLALQQEKNDSIRKKVKSAMTYPVILLVITVGAFFGLMFFVIPKIGQILYDLGGPDAELPMITQVMLSISDFMVANWLLVIIMTGAAIFGFRAFIKTPKGKLLFHTTIVNIPGVGPIIRKVAVARFARTFSALLGAGVSVLETLRVTANAIGNEAFKNELLRGAEAVKSGGQLSIALSRGDLFPPIVPQMLAVGEETGETSKILIKIADFYEEEVDASIASISSIIEPVMIVVMGGMVGLIAISVMGPITSLSQNI